jgi:pimeloyl-ACP methyl ester carboxylesterase
MPTPADFQAMRDAYDRVAPDPAHFDEFAAKTSTVVHELPGWTDELRSLQVPTLLMFGDRDFSPCLMWRSCSNFCRMRVVVMSTPASRIGEPWRHRRTSLTDATNTVSPA